MMRHLVFVACAWACSSAPSRPAEPAPPAAPPVDGTRGAVCAWGELAGPDRPAPAPCGDDLGCCYPCGMPGCNSVCATERTCSDWTLKP